MKPFTIIFIVIAVLGLGGSVYFFIQTQSLENQVLELQDAKSKTETELAALKATDLAKEVELLNLKLKTAETGLATAQKEITNLRSQINDLTTNISKIEPYLNAITAIEKFLGGPFTASNLGNIDAKINLLQDSQVTSQWLKAKENIDMARNSWSPQEFFDTVFLVNSKIRDLLR